MTENDLKIVSKSNYPRKITEAGRGAGAQSVNVNGTGFDPHSSK